MQQVRNRKALQTGRLLLDQSGSLHHRPTRHVHQYCARLHSRNPPGRDDPVIPPFLTGCIRRIYAANFSFWAGVMPPMPRCPAMVCLQTMRGMLGRSLL